jgi:uncharacterized protein (TIGR02452 family)
MGTKFKSIAEDTLRVIEQGYYYNKQNEKIEIAELVQYAVNNTELYSPAQLKTLLSSTENTGHGNTKFEVINKTTLDAARRLAAEGETDIMCLNFASAKNAGGGFLGGAVAQEESIARASGLYPCLLQAPEYYTFHRNQRDLLYSDHMIWSPRVPVFKYENGQVTDNVLCISIITSAAVNAGVLNRNNNVNEQVLEAVMRTRIEKLLALCVVKKHRTLILGAWGCGVFRNDPDMIAGLFHEALTGKFSNCFNRVVFAVKTNNESVIEPFTRRFLNN